MIKFVDILNELGEGSKSFNTKEVSQGQQIWFNIDDPDFPISNFWISIAIADKDIIIGKTPDNISKPRFKLDKSEGNAAKIDFGIVENNEWTFPVLNKGYLFGIMGTVVNSIKTVLNKYKNVEYLLFVPANKIKTTTKQTSKLNSNKNSTPQQNTQTSDNGSQRENLYLAFVKKQLPNAEINKENGWNIINISKQ